MSRWNVRVTTTPLGVYVHVPFCSSRCDYCAFATWTDRHHLIDDYLAAVRRDIARRSPARPGPSRRCSSAVARRRWFRRISLVAALGELPLVAGAEVTVECNPDDVTDELLTVFATGGVTRISLGVQSMVPRILALLGRQHDPDNVIRAVESIRRIGFASFNLDLIYGTATERLDEWRATLEGAIALDPPHISAYGLTVEPGTPLAADPARYPDDDMQAEEYELADELLTAAGLVNYEVSNWARPGP